ncbi:hypothetical protein [Falsiroseomonas tokyonensis]|uniref:Uncharacterized protein n=1 Tax=Falsiroseomonas tokyonensis TaxID=430521 RepID=A0ABV7BV29_9PROT|nr:hypothetical protein [Falsiroseomonas tokyonensis]MBU8539483.1 hypothetical protein [Falsiroseomonas tokyonensis]
MRVSCVLHHPDGDRQNLACHPEQFTQIGEAAPVASLRELLTLAGEARRRGDVAAADLLEWDALRLLRATMTEAGAHG